MTQTDAHQCTMYNNIQSLLNILRLYNSHILMLHLSNLR